MSADTGSGSILHVNLTPRRKMRYMYSYMHVFEHDDWFMTLILGSVCSFFIPVIGPIVFAGYLYQGIEGFIRRPNQKMSKFDFNQFTQRLTRGVYPFVVALILQFLGMAVSIIISFFPMAIVPFIVMLESGVHPIAPLIGLMLIMIFYVVVLIISYFALALIMPLLMLRAGLSQSFKEIINFRWICSFVRMMWLEQTMSSLFLIISSISVLSIGMLMCFVGVWPAAVLTWLAGSHLTYQQYAIFLAKGGEPIPLKEETPCYPVEQPR
jgi:hypothetical protein